MSIKTVDGRWKEVLIFQAEQDELKTNFTDGQPFLISEKPVSRFKRKDIAASA